MPNHHTARGGIVTCSCCTSLLGLCASALLLSVWCWPVSSLAASGIWRCVDDQGQITWSDLGCRGSHSIHHPQTSSSGLVPVLGNGLTSKEQQLLEALHPAPAARSYRGSRPQTQPSPEAAKVNACAAARAAVAKHRQRGRQGYQAKRSSAHQQQRLSLRRAVQESCG